MNKLLKLAYLKGALHARSKVAVMAAPILYAPRKSQKKMDHAADEHSNLWDEIDRSLNTWNTKISSDGFYGQGGVDADQPDPNRFKRMSSAMQQAFNANDSYDQSYGPESAMTQPHGAKYAAGMGLGSVTAGMPSSSTSMTSITKAPTAPKMPAMPGAMKPPDPRGAKPPGMGAMNAIQSTVPGVDSLAGMTSPNRRLSGSPV